MIDVIVEKERNLKNLKQIGTPQKDDRIYVENLVYAKIKEENHKERTVHVLMGHTERMNGTYATFVEAAIPVNDMEYSGGTPRWNNKIWNGVFREIKRLYENMIIVGWEYDMKGLSPKMTKELERIHREFFGGIHQIFLLMDSTEKEETFYAYKESCLIPKEGFYIYYHSKSSPGTHPVPKFEMIDLNQELTSEEPTDIEDREVKNSIGEDVVPIKGGRYRELLQKKQQVEEKDGSNLGIVVAVALLIFVIGVGAYENRDTLFKEKGGTPHKEAGYALSETTEDVDTKASGTEVITSDTTIPVEIIPGETEKSSE
jgi:hypothetical protein